MKFLKRNKRTDEVATSKKKNTRRGLLALRKKRDDKVAKEVETDAAATELPVVDTPVATTSTDRESETEASGAPEPSDAVGDDHLLDSSAEKGAILSGFCHDAERRDDHDSYKRDEQLAPEEYDQCEGDDDRPRNVNGNEGVDPESRFRFDGIDRNASGGQAHDYPVDNKELVEGEPEGLYEEGGSRTTEEHEDTMHAHHKSTERDPSLGNHRSSAQLESREPVYEQKTPVGAMNTGFFCGFF